MDWKKILGLGSTTAGSADLRAALAVAEGELAGVRWRLDNLNETLGDKILDSSAEAVEEHERSIAATVAEGARLQSTIAAITKRIHDAERRERETGLDLYEEKTNDLARTCAELFPEFEAALFRAIDLAEQIDAATANVLSANRVLHDEGRSEVVPPHRRYYPGIPRNYYDVMSKILPNLLLFSPYGPLPTVSDWKAAWERAKTPES